MQDRLLAIVGPTAAGKSALAIRLAQRLGGEIVSADSRQVYRYMDIGTGKPSAEDRRTVPHHLINVVDPDEEYSLALFLRQAWEAIQSIQARSKLPILVGGAGQYIWGLLEGWQVPGVPPDPGLRSRLEERARAEGAAALHKELAALNPNAAGRIDARNLRRVIRALEVHYASADAGASGSKKSRGASSVSAVESSLQGRYADPPGRTPPGHQTLVLGLTLERSALYRRIDDRVDGMIESGWVGEVRLLLERGYGPELPSLSSLGYKELAQHLEGKLSLDEAASQIKHRTHRFARQQHAWFRPTDERISWSDAGEGLDRAEAELTRWLDTMDRRGV